MKNPIRNDDKKYAITSITHIMIKPKIFQKTFVVEIIIYTKLTINKATKIATPIVKANLKYKEE